jgi:dTDP-4-dehydrorhamnose 3,5-epimerase
VTSFRRLDLPGAIEITPVRFGDERGFFSEVFKRAAFEAEGIDIDWIQDNQSLSVEPGTLRGLHFQVPPFAQDKLVRVLKGAIFDVAVDIRSASPSYGRWVGVELSAEMLNQLLVPAGFAHGFLTLTSETEVLYKVSAPYSQAHEGAIRWNDPDLGIDWPNLTGGPILSDKDRHAPSFADFDSPFPYEG